MDEWCSEPEPDSDPVVQGDVLLVLPAGVGVGAEVGGEGVPGQGEGLGEVGEEGVGVALVDAAE